MNNELLASISVNNVKHQLTRLTIDDFNNLVRFRDYETGIPQFFTDDGRYWPYICESIAKNSKFNFEIYSIDKV